MNNKIEKVIVFAAAGFTAVIVWSVVSVMLPPAQEIPLFDAIGYTLLFKGFEIWFKKLH